MSRAAHEDSVMLTVENEHAQPLFLSSREASRVLCPDKCPSVSNVCSQGSRIVYGQLAVDRTLSGFTHPFSPASGTGDAQRYQLDKGCTHLCDSVRPSLGLWTPPLHDLTDPIVLQKHTGANATQLLGPRSAPGSLTRCFWGQAARLNGEVSGGRVGLASRPGAAYIRLY